MLMVFIPDEIESELSGLTDDKQAFVIDAVKQKINIRKKTLLPNELANEYADSVEENRIITSDYEHADLENLDDY